MATLILASLFGFFLVIVFFNWVSLEVGGDGPDAHHVTWKGWVLLVATLLLGMSISTLPVLNRLSQRMGQKLFSIVATAYSTAQQAVDEAEEQMSGGGNDSAASKQQKATTVPPQRKEVDPVDKLDDIVREREGSITYVGDILTLVPLPPGLNWYGYDSGAMKLRIDNWVYKVKSGENPFRLYIVDSGGMASHWFPIERSDPVTTQ
ncbi:hypothetical protein COU76_06070 [Candidatus Peregrinibacteria bacterium CG10_big_fil_rev_8_21_14_0_10_49_10]|nr:MAG: hypothetical protein COU76_06070 [Candidatus Peregrinibacteria bacterium CG10_big_fil_rev_8_21_14_0_10_49_10]